MLRGAFAACLQETWRLGREELADADGSVFLGSGLAAKTCRRGAEGVGLWLSRGAVAAWEAAGRAFLFASPRLLAIRLLVHDARGRELSLVLVSGYAPDSGKPIELSDAFYADVDALLLKGRASDVFVFGCDANATIGTDKSQLPQRPRGPHGLDYISKAGHRLLSWLRSNNLA